MPRITVEDGVSLYYKDWGTGRPVILIHGWPLQADSWDDIGHALVEAGHRVIAYDRRGFGRSDQPWDGYDYDRLADDLAAVIEATGVEDAALVGFSMGGGEVVRYMSRHGGARVSRVALIASVVPGLLKSASNPDGADAALFEGIKAGLLKDRPKFLADFFPGFYGAGLLSSPVSKEVIAWSVAMAMQAGLRPTLACVDAWGRTDFAPDLAAVTVPTLIVHGTADETVPIDITARRVARILPHAQLVEVEGGPHGLPATHKEAIAQDLIAFLA
ncbi:alpha/beta fold hydrolase [Sphingomonas morindae]|uniref:Alpha/beta hydrolase n=1 Tax=Sphingomonas morindae TaxID=1541170 RepID=A0ABY4X5L7_9SPHN|nr:alpha/beta hydrolase [Sphingomonas morindae]USI72174.1 alpha/beta hydrolase [Sphingomonas morindae]